jgi:hypothetical protein
MVTQEPGGLIHEKNLKSKISWFTVPLTNLTPGSGAVEEGPAVPDGHDKECAEPVAQKAALQDLPAPGPPAGHLLHGPLGSDGLCRVPTLQGVG